MATIDDALFSYLSSYAGLTALVGAGANARIFPDMLDVIDASILVPALTFGEVSLSARYSQSGDSNLDTARFQFGCWGDQRTDAMAVAIQLRSALSGKRVTAGGVQIGPCFVANSLSQYDDGTKRWRRIVDYMITYKV